MTGRRLGMRSGMAPSRASSRAAREVARPPVEGGAQVLRTRRHPRPTQFDYLHLRYLLNDIAGALARVTPPPKDVLDVWCGARPYEDLLPSGASCTGLDIEDRYGAADVVSDEFLPFPDACFDLVLCTEAFHYLRDPAAGVDEIRRVLRPGGSVVITVPLVWEYDRTVLEHRFTGPALAALFGGWEGVEVRENGGRAVSWTTLTGSMLRLAERRMTERRALRILLEPLFSICFVLLNGFGLVLARIERRYPSRIYALPMNLLLTARRPNA
jgi:SAM-dependent methyltransferase